MALTATAVDDRPPRAKANRTCPAKMCRVVEFKCLPYGSVPHAAPICPCCWGPGILDGVAICGKCGEELEKWVCPNKPELSDKD